MTHAMKTDDGLHTPALPAERKTFDARIAAAISEIHPQARNVDDKKINEVKEDMTKKGFFGRGQVEQDAVNDFVKSVYRVESKSCELVSAAYVIFDGAAFFEQSVDALLYLKEQGYSYADFGDAHNAGEDGVHLDCWHEDFFETYEID